MTDLQAQQLISKLRSSERILIVLGAGLSRPSGLPTYRDDAWFWQDPVETTATETAFQRDPVYVWAVYERLRTIARNARPNSGHVALARLASAKKGLLTVSQNIDELCREAGHDPQQLVSLHGSLFSVRCSAKDCGYSSWNYNDRPTVPGLETLPSDKQEFKTRLSHLKDDIIPICPSCQSSKLRPGVHWFGEKLPAQELRRVDAWLESSPRVELVLVIGTERTPFVKEAIGKGAEVAWLNYFEDGLECTGGDWYVNGCASETLPFLVQASLG